MKVAVVSDVLVNSGGGLHMAMTAFSNFKKIKNTIVTLNLILFLIFYTKVYSYK